MKFHQKLLRWYDQQGRDDLPWRKEITPYRVWLSEIMLQQTQVRTALPYFLNFLSHFPTIEDLAHAPVSQVLTLWSGLGYYARARNLHKTAQRVVEDYQGHFPSDIENLKKLPGIGPSTAGAIYAIAFKKHGVILDGNVKRVLSRIEALTSPTEKDLWTLAQKLTPVKRVDDYTQAIMDFGATVCTPKNPLCKECPFQQNCKAYLSDSVALFPSPKKTPLTRNPVKEVFWILPMNEKNQILLMERPLFGIWGGLWCPLECNLQEDPLVFGEKELGISLKIVKKYDVFKHVFSHFTLKITPLLTQISSSSLKMKATSPTIWYDDQPLGLPAPVKKFIQKLKN